MTEKQLLEKFKEKNGIEETDVNLDLIILQSSSFHDFKLIQRAKENLEELEDYVIIDPVESIKYFFSEFRLRIRGVLN